MKTRYKILTIIGIMLGFFLIFPVPAQDCNTFFIFPNGICFVTSYQICMTTQISKAIYTVEGDPVSFHAIISKDHKNLCQIEYSIDSTQDRFGSGEIEHYLCHDVKLSKNELLFQCDRGEIYFPL